MPANARIITEPIKQVAKRMMYLHPRISDPELQANWSWGRLLAKKKTPQSGKFRLFGKIFHKTSEWTLDDRLDMYTIEQICPISWSVRREFSMCNQLGWKNRDLLQNTRQFPDENRGFATRMGPPGGVFVAKLPGQWLNPFATMACRP
jgi:hypothetical protein